MNKTKIDWATMSWNPVTGCRHGCPYGWIVGEAEEYETPSPLAEFGLTRPPMSWQYIEIPDDKEE